MVLNNVVDDGSIPMLLFTIDLGNTKNSQCSNPTWYKFFRIFFTLSEDVSTVIHITLSKYFQLIEFDDIWDFLEFFFFRALYF